MVSEDALAPPVRIVTLLTDFGLSDTYVGVMKGVILSRAPDTRIVDLSHAVTPQAVAEAAFLLETAWRFFPAGSVHLVVVDPSVGSARRRLAFSIEGHLFVGPDNGCLSGALPEALRGRRQAGGDYASRQVLLPREVNAVLVEDEALFRQPVSATFEGRDVFAPAAAHLARGGALAGLGRRTESLQAFPAFRAPKRHGGLDGLVLRVDRFGNLITDIHVADLPPEPSFTVAGRRLGLARTYTEARGPAAVIGSSGYVEIAVSNGNAALALGAGPGDRVRVGTL